MKRTQAMRFMRNITFAALMVFASSSAQAQRGSSGPFAGLHGSWSGTGIITLQNGGQERIRCRATYAVGDGGASLRQQLRCASDSYTFNLSSDVVAQGSAISGTWTETTRGASGTVTGRASGAGNVQVRVDSPGFAANLSMSTRGNRQAVSISSSGTALARVSITLSRASG
jgi:hypothetical protein